MKIVFWRKPEELAEIHVVWSLLKPKATAVVEVHGKLRRKTLGGSSILLFVEANCTEKWTRS